jgi:hypothetical protein
VLRGGDAAAIISVLSPCSSYGTSSLSGQQTGEAFFGKLLGRSSPGVGKFRGWSVLDRGS